MGQRMFVAVLPPEHIRDELEEFLEARPGITWTPREQWHITLAFCESVPLRRIDEFSELLVAATTRRRPFRLRLAGAGAFPSPDRPRVLWSGVEQDAPGGADVLAQLSVAARNAANRLGAVPDGARFRPHLTLARMRGREDATRWLRVLETFRSSWWEVEEIALVASYLGEGPRGGTRYDVVEYASLGYPGAA